MLSVKSTYIYLTTFVCFIIIFAAPLAKAEDNSSDITAFPAVIEANIEPGATYNTDLVITNKSNKPLPIEIETKSLIPIDEILDVEKRKDFDASKWVKIDNKSLALEAGESKKIKVNIDVPSSAKPGGRYAEITIKELSLQTNQILQNSSVIQPQINIPILLTIAGESKEELLIESSDKFPEFIGWNSTLNTNVTIANTGTTHLLPSIELAAYKKDKLVSSYNYSPGIILPNTKKNISVDWQPKLPIGFYKMKINVSYGNNNSILESEYEKALVFFPLRAILMLMGVSVTSGYLFAKRANIVSAAKVLTDRRPQK